MKLLSGYSEVLRSVESFSQHFRAAWQQAIPAILRSVELLMCDLAAQPTPLLKRENPRLASTLLHFWFLPVSKRLLLLVETVESLNTSQRGYGYAR
jgi:hypothetical protein